MPNPPKVTTEFSSLIEVVQALRGPDGCPWDKEQTHKTLAQYAIEEAHEFAEAAERNDQSAMAEELGDMLLQVVLNAVIAEQEGSFQLRDVIQSITEKMIRRHPHVFSDLKVRDAQDVLDRWGDFKAKEGNKKKDSPFENIPVSLPALQRASKIGAKTKAHRFDWANVKDVVSKVDEEISELKSALSDNDQDHIESELGDVLFSVAQLARHLNIDPEQALRKTNARFETRFLKMRKLAADDKREFDSLSEAELEKYWQKSKRCSQARIKIFVLNH